MNYQQEVVRSFATISDMLADRGEDVDSLRHVSGADVLAIAASRNVFSVDLPSCGYRVVYDLHIKFKLGDVKKLLEAPSEQLETEGAPASPRVFLVVAREKPAASAKKGIVELGKDVQFFDIKELQYNVSRHTLVPRHEVIRGEPEVEEVMQRFHVKSRYHLPLILSTDPMARYLALKPGQLVRITRVSPSAGHYTLYRCCQRA